MCDMVRYTRDMMKISIIVLGIILAVLVEHSVQQWTGNVCSRTSCSYRLVQRCAYKTWSACCLWKHYWVPDYEVAYFCCAGWTSFAFQNCDRAICSPGCGSGGMCVTPNVCRCGDGIVGPTCNTLVCNYERPCFPGLCTPATGGGQPECNCTKGFESPSSSSDDLCRKLETDQKPVIFEAYASMSFWQQGTDIPTTEKYALYVDSTRSDVVDSIWTNRQQFNRLDVTASAQYIHPELDSTAPPTFLSDFRVGITQAEVKLLLEKTPYIGSEKIITLNMSLPCGSDISDLNPKADTYYCNISKPNFDRSFEHFDTLVITFKAWSGGYRSLQQISPNHIPRETQTFVGRFSEKAMTFRFDFIKPTHPCLPTTVICITNTMLYLDNDITKNSVILRWSNWDDTTSGMFRYSWEVFRLQVDGNLVLKEPDPLNPIHGPIEVNQSSSNSFMAIYTPPQPGVYSFILEVSDRANNSLFVRRIAIYDPSSSITINTATDKRMHVSSADPNSDYKWQTDSTQDLLITWTNHFVNGPYDEGQWLNQVLAYPPQLEDFLKNIPQNSSQDDHEGQRTVDEIPNKRGIVKFEIAKAKDQNGGLGQTVPTTGWTDVQLNDSFRFDSAGQTGGDTVTVWVRATDAMGNKTIDSTKVSFDDTPPQPVSSPLFQRDIQTDGVPYSSTVRLEILDMQSGLKHMDIMVFKAGSSDVVFNQTFAFSPISQSACGNRSSCFCPQPLAPDCYEKTHILAVSNCLLVVENELDFPESVDVSFDVINNAGLVTTMTLQVGDLKSLNGSVSPPGNVIATNVTETTATVTWTHSPSCYNRTEVWISYQSLGGQETMTQLHHSATSYNLTNLRPGTSYTIELISRYGVIKSDPVSIVDILSQIAGLGVLFLLKMRSEKLRMFQATLG